MSNVLREAFGLVIYRRNIHDVVEYLLLQPSSGDCHYTPPNGKVKNNDEDYMKTAIRETEEETGITEDDLNIDLLYQKTIWYSPNPNGFPIEVTYWVAHLINSNQPIKLSREHKAYVWLSIEEALIKVELPEMQKLLRKCEKHIKRTKDKTFYT